MHSHRKIKYFHETSLITINCLELLNFALEILSELLKFTKKLRRTFETKKNIINPIASQQQNCTRYTMIEMVCGFYKIKSKLNKTTMVFHEQCYQLELIIRKSVLSKPNLFVLSYSKCSNATIDLLTLICWVTWRGKKFCNNN